LEIAAPFLFVAKWKNLATQKKPWIAWLTTWCYYTWWLWCTLNVTYTKIRYCILCIINKKTSPFSKLN
jgi:hypothetical protein